MLRRKEKKAWLVCQPAPELALGMRWYYRKGNEPFITGETEDGLPAPASVNALLLLPGSEVAVRLVTSASPQRDALQWQLEPLLLSEMQQVHFVALSHEGEQRLVAVTDATCLRAHCERLRGLGFEPQRALPETLLLSPGTVIQSGTRQHLRLADGSALTLSATQWSALYKHDARLAALQPEPAATFADLARRAIASPCNLLQYQFRPRQPASRVSLWPGVAALLLMLTFVAEPLWFGWQHQRQLNALHQQQLARYQHYFPDERPDMPRRQLGIKLNQLRQAPQAASLPELLYPSAPLLAKLNNNTLKSLNWNGERLELSYEQPINAAELRPAPEGLWIKVDRHLITISRKP